MTPTSDHTPREQSEPHPARDGLVITNEAGFQRKNPPWHLVEKIIRELDTGSGNSFCCLEAPDRSYVQTLHGLNGWHLEWRVMTTDAPEGYFHYRAAYPGASAEAAELKKQDGINTGQRRDLLPLDAVIDTFGVFYRGGGLPVLFDWRTLDL